MSADQDAERQRERPRRGIAPLLYIDEEWLALHNEEVLAPQLPIIDPHHHLWDRATPYLAPQLAGDLNCGHNIRGTVYIECSFAYRTDGDPRFACVGEVEYANGIAALFASGYHGEVRACAGIIGKVDLSLGALAEEVLHACMARAPSRFRGIRQMAAWDASPDVNVLMRPPPKDLLLDPRFREGFSKLAPLGLSFDAWVYHPQLPQLIDLVDAFPDTRIIVDHIGGLVATGPYAIRKADHFDAWQSSMQTLAERPNVFVKIGGLNMRGHGCDFIDRTKPPTSEELALAWKPHVETCIEMFGADRCMFESNFPPDKCGVSAVVLWNAFKRLTAGCSDVEKANLFADTAIRVYRLPQSLVQTEVSHIAEQNRQDGSGLT
ncbi:amidohydrolase [Burkholderia sp. Bp9143]|uniref:amidohydrolase family protein n=1 Tax=Burkholderia sp. Bp9143 TaxID=2184574 RepID=UPI000F5A2061|nr:amidohydrolase family protein [Burkholderia sp. Bp9143]RQR22834.1 amidohydrolase [Burkholderia sp. Bp9143]